MMDSVKASGPTTPATPRVDLQGNNPQAYMVHKKYPESILGPWGQTSLDIGIFSISFGMLVVGQDNFLFSCLGWVLQHPNCNPCAEATTRGPASVFTGTMWGAGLLHCHPNIQSTFMRGAGSAVLLFCHRPNWVQYHGGEKADSAIFSSTSLCDCLNTEAVSSRSAQADLWLSRFLTHISASARRVTVICVTKTHLTRLDS